MENNDTFNLCNRCMAVDDLAACVTKGTTAMTFFWNIPVSSLGGFEYEPNINKESSGLMDVSNKMKPGYVSPGPCPEKSHIWYSQT